MKGSEARWRFRPLWLVAGLLALSGSGCLAVAAGVAAGGAAGYAYYAGAVDRAYVASLPDTRAALHTALAELGMPVLNEEQKDGTVTLQSRTADDDKVHITLETVKSAIPAEGTVTNVTIRVRWFGDKAISERILFQIGAHLAPPRAATLPALQPPLPPQPVLGPTVQPASATARGVSSSEPPLAK